MIEPAATSSTFPVTDAFQRLFGGVRDAFVTALTPDGSALVNSSFFGGSGTDFAWPDYSGSSLSLGKLSLFSGSVPALISYVDHEGRYVLTNKAYGDWFQVDPEQLAGRKVEDVLGPELYASSKDHAEAALSGQEAHFNVLAPHHDGQNRWLEVHYIPDFGHAGEVRGQPLARHLAFEHGVGFGVEGEQADVGAVGLVARPGVRDFPEWHFH